MDLGQEAFPLQASFPHAGCAGCGALIAWIESLCSSCRSRTARLLGPATAPPAAPVDASTPTGVQPPHVAGEYTATCPECRALGGTVICPVDGSAVEHGGCCPECGVMAGEPCFDCQQPMYHADWCSQLDEADRPGAFEAGVGRPVVEPTR